MASSSEKETIHWNLHHSRWTKASTKTNICLLIECILILIAQIGKKNLLSKKQFTFNETDLNCYIFLKKKTQNKKKEIVTIAAVNNL